MTLAFNHSRELTAAELSVMRHLGVHCGVGGQVILKRWQRRAATGPWRMGLVLVWMRLTPDIGIDGTFFGLTDRGRKLAATLLLRNPSQPRHAGKTRKGASACTVKATF